MDIEELKNAQKESSGSWKIENEEKGYIPAFIRAQRACGVEFGEGVATYGENSYSLEEILKDAQKESSGSWKIENEEKGYIPAFFRAQRAYEAKFGEGVATYGENSCSGVTDVPRMIEAIKTGKKIKVWCRKGRIY